eukprot:s3238_g9.t1
MVISQTYEAFQVNTESHLQPVLCSSGFDETEGEKVEKEEGILSRHHMALLKLIAKEAGCEPSDIVDADLCLMDAQAGKAWCNLRLVAVQVTCAKVMFASDSGFSWTLGLECFLVHMKFVDEHDLLLPNCL